MQPPTWVLTGLAGVVIGIAGLGIGYELRDGGSDGAAVTASEPVALPTACAYLTEISEMIFPAYERRQATATTATPIWQTVDNAEKAITLREKACRQTR